MIKQACKFLSVFLISSLFCYIPAFSKDQQQPATTQNTSGINKNCPVKKYGAIPHYCKRKPHVKPPKNDHPVTKYGVIKPKDVQNTYDKNKK